MTDVKHLQRMETTTGVRVPGAALAPALVRGAIHPHPGDGAPKGGWLPGEFFDHRGGGVTDPVCLSLAESACHDPRITGERAAANPPPSVLNNQLYGAQNVQLARNSTTPGNTRVNALSLRERRSDKQSQTHPSRPQNRIPQEPHQQTHRIRGKRHGKSACTRGCLTHGVPRRTRGTAPSEREDSHRVPIRTSYQPSTEANGRDWLTAQ